MGLLGFGSDDSGDGGYKDPLFPGCRVEVDKSNPHRKVVKCNPKKVYNGKQFVAQEGREFEAVVETDDKGRIIAVDVIDDAGVPLAVRNAVIKVIRGQR